jgi:hypothetical protein
VNLALMCLSLIYIFELWLHASMIVGASAANPSFLFPFLGFASYRISDYWPINKKDRMMNAASPSPSPAAPPTSIRNVVRLYIPGAMQHALNICRITGHAIKPEIRRHNEGTAAGTKLGSLAKAMRIVFKGSNAKTQLLEIAARENNVTNLNEKLADALNVAKCCFRLDELEHQDPKRLPIRSQAAW